MIIFIFREISSIVTIIQGGQKVKTTGQKAVISQNKTIVQNLAKPVAVNMKDSVSGTVVLIVFIKKHIKSALKQTVASAVNALMSQKIKVKLLPFQTRQEQGTHLMGGTQTISRL